MNLNEILLANGIGDELVGKILGDMKSNKIYTASEENLDIRYQKLKNEQSASAQTISELQTQLAELEQLKVQNVALVDEANKKIAEMQAENNKIRVDNALERALLDAKVQDVDYVKYKLKEKHTDGFKLDDNGKIDGINALLDEMKIQIPTQFEKTEKKIEEKRLEKADDNNGGVTSEMFNKMDYHAKAKLFKENPEQYANLTKGE